MMFRNRVYYFFRYCLDARYGALQYDGLSRLDAVDVMNVMIPLATVPYAAYSQLVASGHPSSTCRELRGSID